MYLRHRYIIDSINADALEYDIKIVTSYVRREMVKMIKIEFRLQCQIIRFRFLSSLKDVSGYWM